MKRFIPVLVVVLVLSSLGTWNSRVYASTSWTSTLAVVGGSGESGTVVLTATDPTVSPTEVYITDHNATGVPVTGPRTAGIYNGKCTGLGTLAYSLTNLASGTSDTTGVTYSLNALTGKGPYYAIVLKNPTTHLIVSCADVGMPSVTQPIVIPFRIVYDPVSQPSNLTLSPSGFVRVGIYLSGQLEDTEFPAYIRKGTCDNLDLSAPVYTLNDVVNGQSITPLVVGVPLNSGLVLSVEKPNAPGNYVACTEIGIYAVSADLKPLNNSGVSGQITATLQIRLSHTGVVVNLSGGQSRQSASALRRMSANIYWGRCPSPGSLPAYALNNFVGGSSFTEVPVNINDLTRGPYSSVIVISKTVSGRRVLVACADIPYFGPNPLGTLPGMPRTGNAIPGYTILPLPLGTLGLIMFVLGLRLTRRASRRNIVVRVRN